MLVSVMLVIVLIKSDDKGMFVVLYIYTTIIHMTDCLEKFLLLYLILVRFKHLNKNIAAKVSWDEEGRKPNAINISDVKIMYLMLYDAHETFNDIYRNPLLLSFTSLMLSVVSNLSNFRKQSTFTASSTIGPPLLQMLILCIICHYTEEEVQRFRFLLFIKFILFLKNFSLFINI